MRASGRAVPAVIVMALLCSVPGRAQAPLFAPLPTDVGAIGVFIETTLEGAAAREADAELALWALADWSRATDGTLVFARTNDEAAALVRVYFVPPGAGQYGEMMPLTVDGRRGAAVFVRPDTEALGPEIAARARSDELFRDTIVYLTCLHELGHALGLAHTSEYTDIMYAFGYGGDIVEYFARYRRQLTDRGDIAGVSGVAFGDLAQLRVLYPAGGP